MPPLKRDAWIVPLLLDNQTSNQAQYLDVLRPVSAGALGFEEGQVVKEVSDATVTILAVFTPQSINLEFPTDSEDLGPPDWNRSLLILRKYSYRPLFKDSLKDSQFILEIDEFKLCNLQPGLRHKVDPHPCMDYPVVQQRLQYLWNLQISKQCQNTASQSMNSASQNSSDQMLALLADMAHSSGSQSSQQPRQRPIPGEARSKRPLPVQLSSNFNIEDFIIPSDQAQLLQDIQEWKPGYKCSKDHPHKLQRPTENYSQFSLHPTTFPSHQHKDNLSVALWQQQQQTSDEVGVSIATCGSQTGEETNSGHELLEITLRPVKKSGNMCSVAVQVGGPPTPRHSAQVQVGDSLAAMTQPSQPEQNKDSSRELFTDSGESKKSVVSSRGSSAQANSSTKRVPFEDEGDSVCFLLECDEMDGKSQAPPKPPLTSQALSLELHQNMSKFDPLLTSDPLISPESCDISSLRMSCTPSQPPTEEVTVSRPVAKRLVAEDIHPKSPAGGVSQSKPSQEVILAGHGSHRMEGSGQPIHGSHRMEGSGQPIHSTQHDSCQPAPHFPCSPVQPDSRPAAGPLPLTTSATSATSDIEWSKLSLVQYLLQRPSVLLQLDNPSTQSQSDNSAAHQSTSEVNNPPSDTSKVQACTERHDHDSGKDRAREVTEIEDGHTQEDKMDQIKLSAIGSPAEQVIDAYVISSSGENSQSQSKQPQTPASCHGDSSDTESQRSSQSTVQDEEVSSPSVKTLSGKSFSNKQVEDGACSQESSSSSADVVQCSEVSSQTKSSHSPSQDSENGKKVASSPPVNTIIIGDISSAKEKELDNKILKIIATAIRDSNEREEGGESMDSCPGKETTPRTEAASTQRKISEAPSSQRKISAFFSTNCVAENHSKYPPTESQGHGEKCNMNSSTESSGSSDTTAKANLTPFSRLRGISVKPKLTPESQRLLSANPLKPCTIRLKKLSPCSSLGQSPSLSVKPVKKASGISVKPQGKVKCTNTKVPTCDETDDLPHLTPVSACFLAQSPLKPCNVSLTRLQETSVSDEKKSLDSAESSQDSDAAFTHPPKSKKADQGRRTLDDAKLNTDSEDWVPSDVNSDDSDFAPAPQLPRTRLSMQVKPVKTADKLHGGKLRNKNKGNKGSSEEEVPETRRRKRGSHKSGDKKPKYDVNVMYGKGKETAGDAEKGEGKKRGRPKKRTLYTDAMLLGPTEPEVKGSPSKRSARLRGQPADMDIKVDGSAPSGAGASVKDKTRHSVDKPVDDDVKQPGRKKLSLSLSKKKQDVLPLETPTPCRTQDEELEVSPVLIDEDMEDVESQQDAQEAVACVTQDIPPSEEVIERTVSPPLCPPSSTAPQTTCILSVQNTKLSSPQQEAETNEMVIVTPPQFYGSKKDISSSSSKTLQWHSSDPEAGPSGNRRSNVHTPVNSLPSYQPRQTSRTPASSSDAPTTMEEIHNQKAPSPKESEVSSNKKRWSSGQVPGANVSADSTDSEGHTLLTQKLDTQNAQKVIANLHGNLSPLEQRVTGLIFTEKLMADITKYWTK